MRAAAAVAVPSPVRTPRPAVVAACTSGPMANTARTRCAARSSLNMGPRLSGGLVDPALHRRGPEPGVALLQLGDLPVVALDQLPAAVGLAVTHHDEIRVVPVQCVVDRELLAGRDGPAGHKLPGGREPQGRIATVVERIDAEVHRRAGRDRADREQPAAGDAGRPGFGERLSRRHGTHPAARYSSRSAAPASAAREIILDHELAEGTALGLEDPSAVAPADLLHEAD